MGELAMWAPGRIQAAPETEPVRSARSKCRLTENTMKLIKIVAALALGYIISLNRPSH